jgi:hypothetical protein
VPLRIASSRVNDNCAGGWSDFPHLASVFGSAADRGAGATYGFVSNQPSYAATEIEAAILSSEIDDLRGRRLISLPFSDYLDLMIALNPTGTA